MSAIGQADEPLFGGTLVAAHGADPKGWTPFISAARTAANYVVFDQLYDRLISYDFDYVPVGELAESWTSSTDGTEWTFNLRDDVYWHDGVKFTAEDVVFWFDLFCNEYPDIYNTSTTLTPYIKPYYISAEATDEYTVVVKLTDFVNLVPLLAHASATSMLTTPKHVVLDDGRKLEEQPQYQSSPIGTGPFKFVEFTVGDKIVLERNDEYFNGAPYLDQLIFRVFAEPATAVVALEAGQVDYITQELGINPQEYQRLGALPQFDFIPIYASSVIRIGFGLHPDIVAEHPWVADKNVRLAFSYAIDRESLSSNVFYGLNTPEYGPVPSSMAYWKNEDAAQPGYDKAKAEELLDQAGYPRGDDGVRFRCDFPVIPYPNFDIAGEFIVESLAEVGIETNLLWMDRATFLDKYEYAPGMVTDKVPILALHGGVGPDPFRLEEQYHSERAPTFNVGFYNNSRVDELIDLAKAIADDAQRKEYYDEVQEILVDDVMNIWLLQSGTGAVYNSDEYSGFSRETGGGVLPYGYWAKHNVFWWKLGETPEEPIDYTWYIVIGAVVIVAIVAIVAVYFMRKKK
jgi:peptide/nickel transport system substrate-binding protein